MEASNIAIVRHFPHDKVAGSAVLPAEPTIERESERFARVVLQTLDLPDAHRATIVIRELGANAIDAVLRDGSTPPLKAPLADELDSVRLALMDHIARLDELRGEHAQRLRSVEIEIAALQRAICRLPVVSDGFGATPALSNAVERLGNLLVSQAILKKIGPQIALAQRTHQSMVAQIECAMQAADVA